MALRDHQSVILDRFNGLYDRGDKDSTPLDHFQECNNLRYIGDSSFGVRPGIGISQDVDVPLENVKRIYNYPTQNGSTLIVLVTNHGLDFDTGEIYHVVNSTTVFGPILSIVGMEDFAFLPYAGRAYISPFAAQIPVISAPVTSIIATATAGAGVDTGVHQYAYTYVNDAGETIASPLTEVTVVGGSNVIHLSGIAVGGLSVTGRNVYRTAAGDPQLKLLTPITDNTTTVFVDTTPDSGLGANVPLNNTAFLSGFDTVDKGLENEFLYVYAGDGTPARKAAGAGLEGTMTIANGAAGHTDAGLHIFGIVSETESGYLSPPAALKTFTTSALNSVSFGSIPTSGDPTVVKRHLVASIVIPTFNGDLEGYDLFFVPDATINNNTDTFLNDISFYDADLLGDASHLFDNYSEIPAGAVLTLYHNRLCLFTTFTDISLGLVSQVGEPEAISQIDGLIVVPPDGNPITNAQELRDVLYTFKRSKTSAFSDNGDVPSSWPYQIIDNALGTPVHGIATVLDSGSSSIDYLIICTYQGISVFNGRYVTPELSWKIEHYWRQLERTEFRKLQIINAPIQKQILVILPDRTVLNGDYGNGMEPKTMRWSPWSFIMGVNTIAINHIDEIILGSDLN